MLYLDKTIAHLKSIMLIMFCCIIVSYSATSLCAIEEKTRISVLYPKAGDRTQKLFISIINNMRAFKQVEISSRVIDSKDNNQTIQQWIDKNNSQLLILLGDTENQISTPLKLSVPIITGAHIRVKKINSAVSLTADPNQLFMRLKHLQPFIKSIHVIYSEEHNDWLIDEAKLAAKKIGIDFYPVNVGSVQESGPALKKLVLRLKPNVDAIWLPYDPVVPTKSLLPDLLQKAWQKNLTIFSGNPYHVSKGSLFALYPDYSKVGRQLIELAVLELNHQNKEGSDKQIITEASYYLNSALNTRTASHLGIQLSKVQKDTYQMLFPKSQ